MSHWNAVKHARVGGVRARVSRDVIPWLIHVDKFLMKSWVFILIGVIVAFGFDEVVGGSVIEDLCAIGEGLGHLDEVTISVEFWPIS